MAAGDQGSDREGEGQRTLRGRRSLRHRRRPFGLSGLPSYVFGPGDIAQAHTEDEWIDLDEVRLASEIYFEFAKTLR